MQMSVRQRLVLSSALMLFLELALIRWTGANIVHLSYFTNFVLLGSFLGIGLGFLRARPGRGLPYYSPVVLAALVAFVSAFPVTVTRASKDVIYFTSLEIEGPPTWVVLPLIFLATAAALMGPAELVGACFLELDRLESYRWDLVGSLAGTVLFTVLSFLYAPPVVWGVIVAGCYLTLLWRRSPGMSHRVRLAWFAPVVASSLVVVALLGVESSRPDTHWSPYYKLTAEKIGSSLHINANGVPHQRVVDVQARVAQEPQYAWPYDRIGGRVPRRVLVVGAGSGSDVALALRRGASQVDAVEIDPRLLEMGRRYNPNQPYADRRVSTHVDDGRAFLERSDARYDLILFALPDSLTLVNGASSLRLESYLFTAESMESVRRHLNPGGAFAMYNYYRETWLVKRYAATVAQAFGHAPCVDFTASQRTQAVITAGLTPADQHCDPKSRLELADAPKPATDNWPFPYLFSPSMPTLYLLTLGMVLLFSLLAVRAVSGPLRRMSPYRDMFALGAAFLLLETKSVTGFALMFGTTWVVNALVFTGVLLAVLAAVEVTRRWPTPPMRVLYGLLGVSLLLAWAVPSSWLLSLPVLPRAVLAISLAFLPVFCANVVFAKRFTTTPDPTTAFGANLLGAMFGGCLEYLALLLGYHGLLVVAGALYAVAFLTLPRAGGGAGAAGTPAPVGAGAGVGASTS